MIKPAKKQKPLVVIGYFIAIVVAAIYFFTGRSIWNAQSTSFLASGLQIIAAFAFFAGALLCLFTHPDVRKTIRENFGMKHTLLILLVSIAGLGLLGSALGQAVDSRGQADTKSKGYASAPKFQQASAAGYSFAGRYHAHPKEVAEKAREDARKKAEEDAKYAAAEKLVVGRWLMPIDAQYLITIRHKDMGYEVETLWHNGDKGTTPLHERKTDHRERFDVVGDVAGTYYIVLDNGELDIREKDGEFVHAVPFHGDAHNLADVDAALDQAKQDLLDSQERQTCAKDSVCAAKDYWQSAMLQCREPIQAQARYDYKWTDGLFGGSMLVPAALWHGKNGMKRHLVDFVGDKIMLQNGFGAWQNYIYVCTLDITDGHLVDVSLRPGRLPDGP